MSRRARIALSAWLVLLLPWAAMSVDVNSPASDVPPDARRGAEQTLLTFPEWYLVHSPAEYARIVQVEPSHDFPFLAQIGQLWTSYAKVTAEQVRQHYPMNGGYHLMIWVIATSTTVEYALRSGYENTIGRVSWLLGGCRLTDEDRYQAKAAQEYVDFIRQQPWYMFDFTSRLRHLWTDVPMWGPGMVRKWERRYALTTEYAVKAVYGKLIEFATRATYDPALMTTDVVVDHWDGHAALPTNVTVLKLLANQRALLSLPRYFNFRIAATALAREEVHISDIAGNTSTILVSVWMPNDKPLPAGSWRPLFQQQLAMPAQTRRVALLVPVDQLSAFLVDAPAMGMMVEHVYDY
jgi:hypothetical protein